jgi:D-tagatose-1,6-bisphosphate aldolase subunit GatZ/KbaZ
MKSGSVTNLLSRLDDHKQGKPVGVYAVCSSHPAILKTTLKFAQTHQSQALIETTCNQVNQFGGYSGQTPAQFAAALRKLCASIKFPMSNLVLGGDHLGPYPWCKQSAQAAMSNACQMVADYVLAGYRKIHLDASMACSDDDPKQPLDIHLSAQRTAKLCEAAEQASPPDQAGCLYVIGSEVPAPGGDQTGSQEIQITTPESVSETILATRQEFKKRGLDAAWERVIAIVVQPGVEFSDQSVQPYNAQKAASLSFFIESQPRLIFEAHSTDYQTPLALQQLVRDHFAILKVGPELTFTYREVIFALEQIEVEISRYESKLEPSHISKVIDREMVRHPDYWQSYYAGSEEQIAFSRKFSRLDRIRYYWSKPAVVQALERLFSNLTSCTIPLTLISQYLPDQMQIFLTGDASEHPQKWVEHKISTVLSKYHQAAHPDL